MMHQLLLVGSLKQNKFFQGTQAFTSPTDMASSGVWENVILSKTPTSDGVCGMLFFTILIFVGHNLPNVG